MLKLDLLPLILSRKSVCAIALLPRFPCPTEKAHKHNLDAAAATQTMTGLGHVRNMILLFQKDKHCISGDVLRVGLMPQKPIRLARFCKFRRIE